MSVESWARRASGLLVPTRSFANHPLGRWQPCVGPCCDCSNPACKDGLAPCCLEVEISGIIDDTCTECNEAFNAVHLLSQDQPNGGGYSSNGIPLGCPGYAAKYAHVYAGLAWGGWIRVRLTIDTSPTGDWPGDNGLSVLVEYRLDLPEEVPDCLVYDDEIIPFAAQVITDDTLCDGWESALVKVTSV